MTSAVNFALVQSLSYVPHVSEISNRPGWNKITQVQFTRSLSRSYKKLKTYKLEVLLITYKLEVLPITYKLEVLPITKGFQATEMFRFRR